MIDLGLINCSTVLLHHFKMKFSLCIEMKTTGIDIANGLTLTCRIHTTTNDCEIVEFLVTSKNGSEDRPETS